MAAIVKTIVSVALCGLVLTHTEAVDARVSPLNSENVVSARGVDFDMNDPCFPFTCDANATCVEKKCQCNDGFVPDFSGMKCYATPAQSFPVCSAEYCGVKTNENGDFYENYPGSVTIVDNKVYCCPLGSDGYKINGEYRCSKPCGTGNNARNAGDDVFLNPPSLSGAAAASTPTVASVTGAIFFMVSFLIMGLF